MTKYMLIECAEHTDEDIMTWPCESLEDAKELMYDRFCAAVGMDTIDWLKKELGVDDIRGNYFDDCGSECGFEEMSAWANEVSGFMNRPDVRWKIVEIPNVKRPDPMTVYLLIEEAPQTAFVDVHGEIAAPTCEVVGVYGTDEEARRNKKYWEEEDARIQSECDTDPHEYRIVPKAVTPDGAFFVEDYRQKFIYDFCKLFTAPEVRKNCEGHEVKSMSLNGSSVHIEFIGGGTKDINVGGDSLSAMCVDIIRHGLW